MKKRQKIYCFKYIKQEYKSLSKEHRVALIYTAMDILQLQKEKSFFDATIVAMGYIKTGNNKYIKSGT